MIFAASLAAMSIAKRLPKDNCCTVYAAPGFMSQKETYCLDEGRQEAYDINIWRDLWNDGSIRCGKNVDAIICDHGHEFGFVEGQRELGYKCKASDKFNYEHGMKIGANQNFGLIPVQNGESSIILSLHPWVAKGADYLSLDREEKAYILWNKIVEDNTIQEAQDPNEGFKLDLDSIFDEIGDEVDCRIKAFHSQGNVGKAEWRNLGGHAYTGIFQGADTGFVRLSP